jgi:hypothetical protein
MGVCCPKPSATKVFKINKLLKRTVDVDSKAFLNIQEVQIKKLNNTRNKKQNYFYAIQRNAWTIILDFLSYKDLCQAGKVNK